ncbi:unnamed protein product [Aureobasidium mustum]|uniref:Uncharacterized protein n=1 Tax=Aureobasidium mustum TaxID=2773714 RepID=A0A9N8PI99_9PEZI|nr:unnamed protein product [Aureobasidium mustum]
MWQLPPSAFSSQHTSLPQHHTFSSLPRHTLPQPHILPQFPPNDMAYTTKDPHMADNMEMIRRLAVLETELRIERQQHALAQQCITYMARQLAAQIQTSGISAPREESQLRGRRLERYDRAAEPRIRPELEQRAGGRMDSVVSPSLVPVKTRPVPVGPRAEQTFRTECLAFLERNEAKPKPVDIGKDTDTEGTLFTFENSGSLCSEDPPDKGIFASSWATTEKKVIEPEMQEDLMQFPETDDVSEDTVVAEPEETMIEEQKEEAKQKHAAELRRNQALVMYDPAPSDEAFRTVLVTDIPKDRSEVDVMRMVSGGIIVKVQSMDTTWITKSKTMMITFLHGEDAFNFLRSVEDKVEPRFSLLKTPTYPVNGYLADDMIYNGITRCLAVHGYWALNDNLFRRFTKIMHEADPCDRKIVDMAAEEGTKEECEADFSEAGEIGESGDETEVESETQAGAESESKTSSADEKDADGWPVGGLDYD